MTNPSPRYPRPQHDSRRTAEPAGAAGDMRDTIAQLSKLQRAALATGVAWLREWADLTADYGERLSKTLLDPAQGVHTLGDIGADVLDEYRRYLMQLAALPRIYGLRFLAELERLRDHD